MPPAMMPQEQYVDIDNMVPENQCFVRNTFIHAQGPPPSPPPKGYRRQRRSKSLPRNIGSDTPATWDVGCPAHISIDSPGSAANENPPGDAEMRRAIPDTVLSPPRSSLAQRREFAAFQMTIPQQSVDEETMDIPNTPISPEYTSAMFRHYLPQSHPGNAPAEDAKQIVSGVSLTDDVPGSRRPPSPDKNGVAATPSPCRSPRRIVRPKFDIVEESAVAAVPQRVVCLADLV